VQSLQVTAAAGREHKRA